MRKTIIFLDQQSWLGGAQRVLEATLDSISEHYDCIAAFPDWGPFRSTLAARAVETMDFPIGTYASGRKSPLEMVVFAFRSIYCGVKLAGTIRRRRIALVYVNGPRCLPAGVLAAWLTRRPAIFHLHLILSRRLEILMVRSVAWRLSRILACSNAAADSLVGMVGRHPRISAKTQVLYNPLRQERESRLTWDRSRPNRASRDCITIGMVGRITPGKGHHLLLQAVMELPAEMRKRVHILVVGSEAPGCDSDLRYLRNLQSEAKRQGLEERILWAGYQDDPGPSYARMDVLVHSALSEAMCIAILEALDRGIPVIASRTGGIPEVVRDGFNGMLVTPNDTAALARALELFISRRRLRERLQAGARCSLDRRFSIETFSSRIRTFIGQLCPLTERN